MQSTLYQVLSLRNSFQHCEISIRSRDPRITVCMAHAEEFAPGTLRVVSLVLLSSTHIHPSWYWIFYSPAACPTCIQRPPFLLPPRYQYSSNPSHQPRHVFGGACGSESAASPSPHYTGNASSMQHLSVCTTRNQDSTVSTRNHLHAIPIPAPIPIPIRARST